MLDVGSLRDSLSPLFRPQTMPTGPVPTAVRQWVAAYSKYAQDAIAGGTKPSPFVVAPGPMDRFSNSLDAALRVMWTGVAWTGPSLVGTTLLVPPLAPILEGVAASLIRSRDPELALSLITDALHTYTLGITVSVVPPSGTPVIAPLT